MPELTPESLQVAARVVLIALSTGFVLAIVYQLATGGINLAGLFADDKLPGEVTAARAQLLAVSLITAMFTARSIFGGATDTPSMGLIGLFAASHGVYLSGKSGLATRILAALTSRS